MTNENTAVQSRKRHPVLKALAIGCVVVITLLVAGHFAWKYSGSSQWTFVMEKNGIKVYSLKAPGRCLKDWKAVTRVKTTLNGAVAAMATTKTEDCAEFNPNCVSIQSIRPWSAQSLSGIHLYRVAAPSPFSPRELLIETHATQDPRTKSVVVEFQARPDDLPRNQCCLRLTEYQNSWRFTPVGNGEAEVELVVHMDQGIPYPLMNRVSPIILIRMLGHMPAYFSKPKWQQARFASIQEQ